MGNLHLWKDRTLLMGAFLGFVILGLEGFLLLPRLMLRLQLHVSGNVLAFIGFFVLFFGSSVVVLSWITFRACRTAGVCREERLTGYFRRVGLFCAAGAVLYLLLSLLDGLIAVAVYRSQQQTMDFDGMKGVIDLVTSLLSVFFMPVILTQFFAFALGSGRFLPTIGSGFRLLKRTYLKFLFLSAIVFGLGWLLAQAGQWMDQPWQKDLWLIFMSGLLGTAGVPVLYQTAVGVFEKERRRV